MNLLLNKFGKIECIKELSEEFSNSSDFTEILEKYSSWEWIYGESPSFEAVHSRKFKWGEIEIGLNLTDGHIRNLKIYTDSIITSFICKLTDALKGVKYEPEYLKKAVGSIISSDKEEEIFKDIEKLF